MKDARPSYRPYTVTVARLTRLSPHFVRVTFTGDELAHFGTDGLDQRIKLVLPIESVGFYDFGAEDPETIAEGTWYSRWRDLPTDQRNPFRTYTVRTVRPELSEVDVDMVSHADTVGAPAGPASRWLSTAQVGDKLILVGPDSRSIQSHLGIDWAPGDANQLLLVGDETAAPAICAILESLPAERTARAFIEVPDARDQLPLTAHDSCTIIWLARGEAPVGTLLDPALRAWTAENPHVYRSALTTSAQELVDDDAEILWDSFGEPISSGFYAWLAGESTAIKLLRRHLVSEMGIDRKRISFMGYWRLGRAEAQE